MRIVSALIAVLGLTAVVRPSYSNEYHNQTLNSERSSSRSGGKIRALHKKSEEYKACCPVVEEMVEPKGGRNQNGIYVELYTDDDYKQRFYELSCPDEVLNQPCRFVNKKLDSKCVQKFSYTYALVKNIPDHKKQNLPTFPTQTDGAAYTLDYIEVRSGCSCEVKTRKKKRNGNKQKKSSHEKFPKS